MNIEEYGQGWMDGATGAGFLVSKNYSKSYLDGYKDGVNAFRKALDDVREKYNQPLTSEIQ